MPNINHGIMPLPKAKGKRARKGTLSHTKGKRHASAHQRLMGGLADELFSFCLGHGCTFWQRRLEYEDVPKFFIQHCNQLNQPSCALEALKGALIFNSDVICKNPPIWQYRAVKPPNIPFALITDKFTKLNNIWQPSRVVGLLEELIKAHACGISTCAGSEAGSWEREFRAKIHREAPLVSASD